MWNCSRFTEKNSCCSLKALRPLEMDKCITSRPGSILFQQQVLNLEKGAEKWTFVFLHNPSGAFGDDINFEVSLNWPTLLLTSVGELLICLVIQSTNTLFCILARHCLYKNPTNQPTKEPNKQIKTTTTTNNKNPRKTMRNLGEKKLTRFRRSRRAS